MFIAENKGSHRSSFIVETQANYINNCIFCASAFVGFDYTHTNMEDKGHCVITIVGQDGHNYFQADLDRGKGDRRSDGKLNADFFGVEVASMTIDNVRVSHRLAKRGRDNHEE